MGPRLFCCPALSSRGWIASSPTWGSRLKGLWPFLRYTLPTPEPLNLQNPLPSPACLGSSSQLWQGEKLKSGQLFVLSTLSYVLPTCKACLQIWRKSSLPPPRELRVLRPPGFSTASRNLSRSYTRFAFRDLPYPHRAS